MCGACHEKKQEHMFSRKQWCIKTHRRRCSNCVTKDAPLQERFATNMKVEDLGALVVNIKKNAMDTSPSATAMLTGKTTESDTCPICFDVKMTFDNSSYFACCSKSICNDCVQTTKSTFLTTSPAKRGSIAGDCPFCRTPLAKNDDEKLNQLLKRSHDPIAQCLIGFQFRKRGDMANAMKWWQKSAENGNVEAQFNYGVSLFMTGKHLEGHTWLAKADAEGHLLANQFLNIT